LCAKILFLFRFKFLASLNCDFVKLRESKSESEVPLDDFPVVSNIKSNQQCFIYFLNRLISCKANENENPDDVDKSKIEENNLKKFKNLFSGLKFFLNREVPREQFAFVIRYGEWKMYFIFDI
jgi:hypothetical protein